MKGQQPIESLVYELSRLPGIGRKTAQRSTYYLLDQEEEGVENLAQVILTAKRETKKCSPCSNYSDQDPCEICANPKKGGSILCVVECPKDVVTMEKIGKFNGHYHVLHGVTASQKGLGPHELIIPELLTRLGDHDLQEVILVTNSTQDGQLTALCLAQLIQPMGIRRTRVSCGLPIGGDMEYYDAVTVGTALEDRIEIKKEVNWKRPISFLFLVDLEDSIG